ncbi:hypothetical protein PVAP13_4NG075400 [Panicum virgatum]|uniref:Uncharacterized protein n=2 Tax=Panicum virgatum TaxID=38727 RepID=A0A8T0TG24_PANVG|nr:hypothetical protein PVAP13_4NG075400 [Panicum virgatum]
MRRHSGLLFLLERVFSYGRRPCPPPPSPPACARPMLAAVPHLPLTRAKSVPHLPHSDSSHAASEILVPGVSLTLPIPIHPDLFEMNGRKRNLAPSSSRGPDLSAAVAGGPPGLAAAVVGAPVGVSAASAAAAGAPAGPASSPPASLHANGFPAWWTSSSPVSFRHESSTSAGLYPPGGFTNFMQSNNTLEDFHLVGNTTSRTSVGPSATSYRGTPPGESNAQDKETITVDADETIEDSRTEKRLNWTKDEDIRLASAWVHNSKDPVDGTDRKSDQYWADVT